MRQNEKDDNSYIIQRLRQLGEAPQRDAQKAAKNRAAFLEQARHLAHEKQIDTPVSAGLPMRLKDSMQQSNRPFWQRSLFRRKETTPMATFLTTMLVTLALALGGTGVTAYAAQDSLPNQALYGVKTFTEDVQLQMTTQAENQLSLALKFANRRVFELAAMAKQGESAPETVANRYGAEIDHALQLAAGLPENGLTSALEQVQTQLQQQEQVMAQLCQEHPMDPLLQQTQTRLRQRLQLTENGLKDPQGFQEQLRQQIQNQSQQQNQNQNSTQQTKQNQNQQNRTRTKNRTRTNNRTRTRIKPATEPTTDTQWNRVRATAADPHP